MKIRIAMRPLLRINMILALMLIMPLAMWADCMSPANLTTNDINDYTVTLPFTEDFENGIGNWRVVNTNVHTGIKSVYGETNAFGFYGDGPQYLISPRINCAEDIRVLLYYSIEDTDCPMTFQVGYSTTTYDTSAFTWGTEITGTSWDYVKYEHTFPANTKYVAVKNISSNSAYLYIDNFSIFVDGVTPPAQLSTSTIGCQSVTLTWDPTEGATSYVYQYKKVSESTWSDEVTTTATSATISNLSADTDYDVRMKSIIGNNTSIYTTTQFTTATALPYEMDFENGYGRWTRVDCDAILDEKLDDLWGTGRRTNAAHNGNVGFQFATFSSKPKNPQYLISPRFNSNAAIMLSFYYRVPTGIGETIYVGYSTTTNDKDAFTFGDAITVSSSNWTKYEHTFPAEARFFAIKYASNEYKIFIDDICFEEYSTYAKPTTIGFTEIAETEATLAWNVPSGATGFAYQYKKASDATWSVEATVNQNKVTLSELTPNTYYSFRVKALYDSNNASSYATYSFQTDASVVDLPYSDGFENGMGGWRMADCDGMTNIFKTSTSHSGSYSFKFCNSDQHQYLISPHFAGGTPMKVSFYYQNYESYPSIMAVGYTNSKTGAITWIGNPVMASSGTWTLYETTLPAEAQYVVINSCKEGNILDLDDFKITRILDLANDDDNTDAINDFNKLIGDVTLQGRTFYKDGDWNTLCLPFAVSNFAGTPLEGGIVKELLTSSNLDNNGTLTLNFNTVTSIEAGKPYIVKWESGSDIDNPVFTNVTIDKTNHDVAFTGGTFKGNYAPLEITDANRNDILLLAAGNKLGYAKTDRTIANKKALGACHAYFEIPSNGGGQSARAFELNFGEEETTGIVSTTDGTDITDKAGAIYDLQGRKVENPKKGMYIINGKRVIIK